MPADPNEPRLDVSPDGDRTVVRFVNCTSLNEYTSDRIGQLLANLGAKGPDRHVILDMSNIQYLTSTILGHLLVLHKRLAAGGGRLTLDNVVPAVRDVFRVTLLDQVLDIQPNGQTAV
jgi:anti-sigma B factor antagonist